MQVHFYYLYTHNLIFKLLLFILINEIRVYEGTVYGYVFSLHYAINYNLHKVHRKVVN